MRGPTGRAPRRVRRRSDVPLRDRHWIERRARRSSTARLDCLARRFRRAHGDDDRPARTFDRGGRVGRGRRGLRGCRRLRPIDGRLGLGRVDGDRSRRCLGRRRRHRRGHGVRRRCRLCGLDVRDRRRLRRRDGRRRHGFRRGRRCGGVHRRRRLQRRSRIGRSGSGRSRIGRTGSGHHRSGRSRRRRSDGRRRDRIRRRRRRTRVGRRSRGRVRRGGRWRRRRRRGWEERERVEVALRVGRHPDAEVDERRSAVVGRTDRADRLSLGHGRPFRDPDRAEVDERDRVAVAGLDRDDAAVARHGARERHGSACRRGDGGSDRGADVDAAPLAARVGMVVVEREGAQHRARHRPGPRRRTGHAEEQEHEDDQKQPPHGDHRLCCHG